MRIVIAGLIAVLLLGLGGAAASTVAGDVGPGRNGLVPLTVRLAGDVGPGRNG